MMTNKIGLSISYYMPNYKYDFPLVLHKAINEKMTELVYPEYEGKLKNWKVTITTIFSDKELEKEVVMGPHKSNRTKQMSYGLHLPAKKIIESENPDRTACDYILSGVFEILVQKFGLPEDAVNNFILDFNNNFPVC